MFLSAFALSIFFLTRGDGLYTSSQLVVMSLGATPFLLLGVCFFRFRGGKIITALITGFLLAAGAVYWFSSQQTLVHSLPDQLTGQVVDIRKPDTYLLQTVTGMWLLQSEESLHPGQIVTAGGYGQLAAGGTTGTGEIVAIHDFDYPKRLYMKGYLGKYTATSLFVTDDQPVPRVYSLKDQVRGRVVSLPVRTPTAGLIMGIFIGDRSLLPVAVYEEFIASGLVHIIAVSGSNMVYLLLFGHLLLFFLPYYTRGVVLGGAMICYAYVCGLDSSIVRAMMMGLLTLVLVLTGRYSSILRVITVTFVGMLLWNPYLLVYDLGFVLSYAALLGVVGTGKLLRHAHRSSVSWSGHLVQTYLLPTIGATGGVLPVLVVFGDGYNLLSIVANLLVVPVLPVLYLSAFGSLLFPTGRIASIPVGLTNMIGTYIFWISAQTVDWGVTRGGASPVSKFLLAGTLLTVYQLVFTSGTVETKK